jgi:hypothetical protein
MYAFRKKFLMSMCFYPKMLEELCIGVSYFYLQVRSVEIRSKD